MSDPIKFEAETDDRAQRIRQLVNDCVRRRSAGESFSDQSIIDSHPELMPELAEELRNLHLIAAAEQKAEQDEVGPTVEQALHIRCPHCSNPIELVEDASLSDVACPSCGSHFSLVSDAPRSFQAAELESIGHFKLLDRLGSGAFGSVWSALDTQLDRKVAVKIPRKGELAPQDTEQFIREARAAAQLSHPKIVRVYEVGRHNDRVYIVSDFVEGISLGEWLADQRATSREAAELCATVADALHHAHQHGVIHRDLKPDNIMLDMEGEPHIMDFGLAKRETGEMTMTVEGKLLGTPAYMPPEQARGSAHDADQRSDVYSLGVILFEMLTGERPFRGSTRMLLHQVLVEDAPSPRKLNGSVPKDLETICLKCLEKEPNRRYQTARDLRVDLHRFLRGEPVHARPISKAARASRWCAQNRGMAGLGAAVASLLLFLAVVGPTVAVRQSSLARQNRRLLYFSDVDSAREAWQRNDVRHTQDLLKRHVTKSNQYELRGLEWYYLWGLCQRGITAPTFEHGSVVSDVAFSAGDSIVSSVSSRGVKQWSAATKELFSQPIDPHGIFRLSAKLSPNRRTVAFGHEDGKVMLMDVHSGAKRVLKGHRDAVWAVAFSANGKLLASGDFRGQVVLWDLAKGERTGSISAHRDRVQRVAFSPDGTSLVTGSFKDKAKLWDVDSRKLTRTFDVDNVWAIAFSPNGSTLAMWGSDDTNSLVRLWDVETGRLIHGLKGHEQVASVAFSPDGKTLASADRTILLWDVESGLLTDTLKGHWGWIRSVAFSSDGKYLVSGGFGGAVKLWDLTVQPSLVTMYTDSVECMAVSPDSKMLASAGRTGEVRLWNLVNGKLIRPLVGHMGRVASVSFSADGTTLASASWDATVRLWDVNTGQQLHVFHHNEKVQSVAFSPDGNILASGSRETLESGNFGGTVTLWDMSTRSKLETLTLNRPGGWVSSLAFRPDGKTLASASSNWPFSESLDHAVSLWDVPTRRLKARLSDHPGGIYSLVFSLNGNVLATAGEDGTVKLWDVDRRQVIRSIPVNESIVFDIAFIPSGETLVSVGLDRTVRLWDTTTGQLRLNLPAHSDAISAVAVLDEGRTLVTGSWDDTIKLWHAATPKEVQAAGW